MFTNVASIAVAHTVEEQASVLTITATVIVMPNPKYRAIHESANKRETSFSSVCQENLMPVFDSWDEPPYVVRSIIPCLETTCIFCWFELYSRVIPVVLSLYCYALCD